MRMNPHRGLFSDIYEEEDQNGSTDLNELNYKTADVISSAGLSKISKEEDDQNRLFPDPDLEKLRLKDKKKRKREHKSPTLSSKFLQ